MGKTWKRIRYLVFLAPGYRWGVNVETIMGAYMTVFKNRETPTWTLERCSLVLKTSHKRTSILWKAPRNISQSSSWISSVAIMFLWGRLRKVEGRGGGGAEDYSTFAALRKLHTARVGDSCRLQGLEAHSKSWV